MPWIHGEMGIFDAGLPIAAHLAKGEDIESEMMRTKRLHVVEPEREKPDGGEKATAIGRVVRARVLFFQMNKGSGNLNEAFEIQVIRIPTIQPQMLQHIVGFVVIARIEALKVALIARMKIPDLLFQCFHEGRDARVFAHGLGSSRRSRP